ncbi:MAG TPA: hypothetical protein VFP43_14385 [Mesorhizobium sp.]|nr:hypothetical protein [Mesorhizobium sp.]
MQACNAVTMMRHAALEGFGLVYLPEDLVKAAIHDRPDAGDSHKPPATFGFSGKGPDLGNRGPLTEQPVSDLVQCLKI